jgi:hypothetical protein
VLNLTRTTPSHDPTTPPADRDKALAYFETNAHRMRYEHFRSLGMFVGSGVRWTVRGAASSATPPLPGRRRPVGRDLAATPQPDQRRLATHLPAAPHLDSCRLTPATYKIGAHPQSHVVSRKCQYGLIRSNSGSKDLLPNEPG